jgi:hypothetical protein
LDRRDIVLFGWSEVSFGLKTGSTRKGLKSVECVSSGLKTIVDFGLQEFP